MLLLALVTILWGRERKRRRQLEQEVELCAPFYAITRVAGQVIFSRDRTHTYSLQVWLRGRPAGHPLTYGPDMENIDMRSGRPVSSEVVCRAIEDLKRIEGSEGDFPSRFERANAELFQGGLPSEDTIEAFRKGPQKRDALTIRGGRWA